MKFFKKFKQAVTAKVVGNIIRKKLRFIADGNADELAEEHIKVSVQYANKYYSMFKTIIKDNEDEIVTFCERNSDLIIKIQNKVAVTPIVAPDVNDEKLKALACELITKFMEA